MTLVSSTNSFFPLLFSDFRRVREWGAFWDTVGCLANCAVAFEAAIFGACWGVALGAAGAVAPITVEVGLALGTGGVLCPVVR